MIGVYVLGDIILAVLVVALVCYWVQGDRYEVDVEDAVDGNDPYRAFGEDDFRRVALDYIFREGLRTRDSSMGGSVEQCDRVLSRIEELRNEYASIKPLRLRSAVMDWLTHYEREALKHREDCRTQKSRKERDQFRRESDVENERVNRLRSALRESGHGRDHR